MPDGFSIFCTTLEAGKIKKYQEICEKLGNKIENYGIMMYIYFLISPLS